MKKMNTLHKKLCSQSGESIGETLIALLISSVALMMLASMISSTVSLVTKSETKMNTYYEENTKLENPGSGEPMTITISDGADTEVKESVAYMKNNTFNKIVVSYSYTGKTDTEGDNTIGG